MHTCDAHRAHDSGGDGHGNGDNGAARSGRAVVTVTRHATLHTRSFVQRAAAVNAPLLKMFRSSRALALPSSLLTAATVCRFSDPCSRKIKPNCSSFAIHLHHELHPIPLLLLGPACKSSTGPLPSFLQLLARYTSHHTSHITCRTSHVTHHTSHVTRHTSHITRHTSHVTHHTVPLPSPPLHAS